MSEQRLLPAARAAAGTYRSPAARSSSGSLRRMLGASSAALRNPETLALGAILVVAALLDLIGLGREGYANTYYAAAVKSMLQSWHNFFFVSFDPGGYVTVDKPPLGFWIQTASAKLLGFHGWSLLLPEALAGIASVGVLFVLVRRVFGSVAGLIAALALATTPISVAANRNNTIDSLLVLTVLLAAWAVLRAAERGSLRWLLAGMVLVGLGFNIKMLEAYLVLPALVAVYLLGAPMRWRLRILHLVLASVVLLVVSLSWAVAVDLTPAGQRPYVGSSQHNSEIELAFGYNGLQRLLGMSRGGGARTTTAKTPTTAASASQATAAGSAPQSTSSASPTSAGAGGASAPTATAGGSPAGGFPGGGGPGGTGETGQDGPLRFFSRQLAGQISWLLPLAVLGLLAAAAGSIARRPREIRNNIRRLPGMHLDRGGQQLVLWGVWLATQLVFFSKAGFFHRYYLSMTAPAIAALAGIGVAALWQAYRRGGLRSGLLPAALAVTAVVQALILRPYNGWSGWLIPIVAVPSVLAVLVLACARLRSSLRLPLPALVTAATLGVLALFIAPAVWSAVTVRNASAAGGLPAAGPATNAGQFGPPPGQAELPAAPRAELAALPGSDGPGPGQGMDKTDPALLRYLQANRGTSSYLVAVPSSMSASPLILQTGEPVMALGGFAGGDPILTESQLAKLVASGTVRFFLLDAPQRTAVPAQQNTGAGAVIPGSLPAGVAGDGGMPGPGFGAVSSAVQTWVTTNCAAVPSGEWQSTTGSSSGGFGGRQQLYDCATARS